MSKLTPKDLELLRRVNNPMRDTFLPWRGVIQRCFRLAREGYLVEAGMSVLPPHTLYALTDLARSTLNHQDGGKP